MRLDYNTENCVISVGVTDYDRSLAWYRDVLGFDLVYELPDYGWCELKTPFGFTIGLGQNETVAQGNITPTSGVRDIDAAIAHLRAREVKVEDWHEIPNYWSYAKHFVLHDHMFQADASWSSPEHLYLVSGWSAHCTKKGDPMSCRSAVENPGSPPHSTGNPTDKAPDYAWTDLTYLLHQYGVSWRYYVQRGAQPDCANLTVAMGHFP